MKIADYARMSAAEIAHRVHAREVSAREVAESALEALDALAKRAVHLGTPGKDLTYGLGLVGVDTP